MSVRVAGWLGGFGAGVIAALATPDRDDVPIRMIVFGLTFLLIGLMGEAIDFRRTRAGLRRAWARLDRRPADGVVDVATMTGAIRRANALDPRFGRFVEREATDGRANEPFVELWDGRVSPSLVGRVAIVSVFVGRAERTWSDAEIAGAHKTLNRVGQWIEREAARWSIPANVELVDAYFAVDDESDEELSTLTRRDAYKPLVYMTRIASRLGFPDLIEMFDDVRARLAADSVVWLLHPRMAGWSFAVPRELHPWDRVSLAVCFPEWSAEPDRLDGREARLDAITVTHELMHLFGALDKYELPLSAYDPRLVGYNDIMRLEQRTLRRLQVDPLTAQEIGWARKGQTRPPETTTADASPEETRRPRGVVIDAEGWSDA